MKNDGLLYGFPAGVMISRKDSGSFASEPAGRTIRGWGRDVAYYLLMEH